MIVRSPEQAAWMAGYTRGVQSGYNLGYSEGIAALDDAAVALAGMRPSRWVGVRERQGQYTGPSRTPEEIRARAAQSWGLSISQPETLVHHRTHEISATAEAPDVGVAESATPPPRFEAVTEQGGHEQRPERRASQLEPAASELSLDDWT